MSGKRRERSTMRTMTVSLRKYAKNRWKIFSDSTTLHGVREISRAPVASLKTLWFCIVTLCAVMMFYQIYKLTDYYLKEPVTTTQVDRTKPYKLPMFLLVAQTSDLWLKSPKNDSRSGTMLSGERVEMDDETVLYARTLFDQKVLTNEWSLLPDGYKPERARAKFDRYLEKNNLTWFQALEQYVGDLTPWIEQKEDEKQHQWRVTQRSLWSVATYHVLQPVHMERMMTDFNHERIVEARFDWNALPQELVADRPANNPLNLILTSYGFLIDALRFEPGRLFKIRFDLSTRRQTPLRRKKCRVGQERFAMFDEKRCKETCQLKAESRWAPRRCYNHTDYEWGFMDAYKFTRPCSFGFVMSPENATGDPVYVMTESDDYLPGATFPRMQEEYRNCFADECAQACEEITVKFTSDSRDFSANLGNKSWLYVTLPALNAVPVHEVNLQYTWDSFVGQLGGLVGLWMGASMMSLCEVFYLCCCCCCDVRKKTPPSSVAKLNSVILHKRKASGRELRPSCAADDNKRYGNTDYITYSGFTYSRNSYCDKEEMAQLQPATWVLDETCRV